ncbi:hypothetical protein CBM2587_B10004 [Cupriavidus taiwanensis]|uniref:Uncharacterized protein n=1 Tax=Cupriavidus taiwanensis TaxID=164546 RepID=A0A975X5R8_9BURK|nr:hypothetical protein CBM2587_B10004 [Cupriavidus taiwanensis]
MARIGRLSLCSNSAIENLSCTQSNCV